MAVKLIFSFDSEDYITPEAADAEKWWAEAMTRHGITACICLVGELARQTQRSGCFSGEAFGSSLLVGAEHFAGGGVEVKRPGLAWADPQRDRQDRAGPMSEGIATVGAPPVISGEIADRDGLASAHGGQAGPVAVVVLHLVETGGDVVTAGHSGWSAVAD